MCVKLSRDVVLVEVSVAESYRDHIAEDTSVYNVVTRNCQR